MPTRSIFWADPARRSDLLALGLEQPSDFLSPQGGEVISEVRDRIVYRYPPSSDQGRPGYYLKIFRNRGANRPFVQILSGEKPHSLAEVEQRRLTWLADHGFQAPKVAAWGAALSGWSEVHSFLLTEDLTGLVAFDDWLEAARESLAPKEFTSRKRKLIQRIADLLRDLHRQGFHHPYPYLRHFFVPALDSPVEPEIAIIDVHSAEIGKAVSPRQKARALAELFLSSLKSPVTQTDRWRFLKAYFGGEVDRALVAKTLSRFRSKLKKHPNRYRWAQEKIDRTPFPK